MNRTYNKPKPTGRFQKISLKGKVSASDSGRKIYDLTDSGDMDKLYQKNNRLLSELSSTGRKNTILQTELCSLIEAKSKLGIENSTLSNEVAALKRTVFRFKDQEKKFYDQSLRLKNQFRDFQITETTTGFSKQRPFEKQEKIFSEKLIRFLKYRQKVKQIHSQLKKQQTQQKEKIEHLNQEVKNLKTHHPDNSSLSRFLQAGYSPKKTDTNQKIERNFFNKWNVQKKIPELKDKMSLISQEKKAPGLSIKSLKTQAPAKQKLTQEDQNLKQQTEKLQQTTQNLRTQMLKLKQKNQNLRQQTEKLQQTTHSLQVQAQKLKQENQSKQNHIQALSSRLVPLVKYRGKIKSIHPHIKQGLSDLKSKTDALQGDKEILKKNLDLIQKGNLVLQNKLEIAKKQEELKTTSYQRKTEKLEKKLKNNKPYTIHLKKELKQKKNEINQQEKKQKKQENYIVSLRGELEGMQLREKLLEEKLKNHKPRASHLKEELKKKENRIKQLESGQKIKESQITLLKEKALESQKTETFLKEKLNNSESEKTQMEKNLKETTVLYNNIREIVSRLEEGFFEAMKSYQRKHQKFLKLFAKKEQDFNEILKNLREQNQRLKTLDQKKETELETLKSQHRRQIHSLQQDRQGSLDYTEELEREIRNLKKTQDLNMQEKEKSWRKKAGEEILKYKKAYDTLKTESGKNLANLKLENEKHIEALCLGYEKKFRHIRTEMENDILNETKRAETLKKIKNRQITNMESNLKSLQEELYKTKAENLSFKKTEKISEESLKKESLSNITLKKQNKHLQTLWENAQRELEKRNQQVASLQKLNKDLSLLFTEKKAMSDGNKPQSPSEAAL